MELETRFFYSKTKQIANFIMNYTTRDISFFDFPCDPMWCENDAYVVDHRGFKEMLCRLEEAKGRRVVSRFVLEL